MIQLEEARMEEKINEMRMEGKNVARIAKELGVSVSVVQNAIVHHGATDTKNARRILNEADTNRIWKRERRYGPIRQMAKN